MDSTELESWTRVKGTETVMNKFSYHITENYSASLCYKSHNFNVQGQRRMQKYNGKLLQHVLEYYFWG
jgi:hypothetical protein